MKEEKEKEKKRTSKVGYIPGHEACNSLALSLQDS
jgi:hypothetical protein